MKIKALCLVFFGLGIFSSTQYDKVVNEYHLMDCGNMKGYTTHVVKDMGYEICVWRQNTWPFKTLSGIKV
jgi:hypothetical protein